MTVIEHGPNINLEELRSQLADRIALLMMGASSLLMLQRLPRDPLAVVPLSLSAVLLLLCWRVRKLIGVHPLMARRLLAWGLTAGLMTAMGLLPAPWLPFVALMFTFINAMLVSGGEFAAGGIIAALAVRLAYTRARAYPLLELLAALALGMGLAWLIVRTLYTALEWAWKMQQRTDHLLQMAREHRGELSRTLKSLDTSNSILRRTQRELIVARRQADEAGLMKGIPSCHIVF